MGTDSREKEEKNNCRKRVRGIAGRRDRVDETTLDSDLG